MMEFDNVVILKWTDGWKYQVMQEVTWKLRQNFKCKFGVTNQFYKLWYNNDGWYITVYVGCAWDGPTWFPDFKWMMLASLIHDVLHWLIAKGTISTNSNDKIDAELAGIIRMQKQPLSNLRAWYIEKATNTVDQKLGEVKKIHTFELITEQ